MELIGVADRVSTIMPTMSRQRAKLGQFLRSICETENQVD
jgi:hypothetical protein